MRVALERFSTAVPPSMLTGDRQRRGSYTRDERHPTKPASLHLAYVCPPRPCRPSPLSPVSRALCPDPARAVQRACASRLLPISQGVSAQTAHPTSHLRESAPSLSRSAGGLCSSALRLAACIIAVASYICSFPAHRPGSRVSVLLFYRSSLTGECTAHGARVQVAYYGRRMYAGLTAACGPDGGDGVEADSVLDSKLGKRRTGRGVYMWRGLDQACRCAYVYPYPTWRASRARSLYPPPTGARRLEQHSAGAARKRCPKKGNPSYPLLGGSVARGEVGGPARQVVWRRKEGGKEGRRREHHPR
ncbi:hypothetical protein B0H17DRAFT_1196947 [Mycena rosella]|uniref:Uncharacterized protein n=1 Tax=Mycena rosella TaxID=1033263 RepID=A0AAD7GK09_MYCRO|nr:hypothetical protein B0H17DRAFT_1196947 [Mycena rosella]